MYVKTLNGKSLSVIMMGIMFTLTSCKKDFPPIFKGGHSHSGEPTVLVAGYESNGSFNVAKYWVDGQEIKLSDGTRDASANSMVVSNNDVYIAGSDSGAVYWKNNYEVRLSGDGASSIFVSGNDVYVAGSVGSDTAVYWKNGTKVILAKNIPMAILTIPLSIPSSYRGRMYMPQVMKVLMQCIGKMEKKYI